MTAAGSPGVRRSSPKTTSATTIITGTVAASRRTISGSSELPLDRDVPVQAGRERQHALDVLPVRRWLRVLPPRHVRDLLVRQHLDLVGDLLALRGVGGPDPL